MKKLMRGCLFRVLLVFVTLFVLMLLVGYGLYQSAQKLPEFYATALQVDQQDYEIAGDEFETQVIQLRNDLQQAGNWQAVFTEQQINGWLATDLPEKFPQALPPNVFDPRISISPQEIKLAFRYESSRFSGIVVSTADVYCTKKSNQIAVRIKDVRAGLVRLPISKWLDELSQGISKSGFAIQWTETEGDPVALITLPEQTVADADGNVIIELIELMKGKVKLVGHTTNTKDPPQNQQFTELRKTIITIGENRYDENGIIR
jgi:hypothetical protein